jgi:SP family arabinose:H+ symporter-like MFS transporter
MSKADAFTAKIAFIVALGGFLMGFDASVISGVVKFIEIEFSLTKIQVGWSVASLALTASLAMMVAGPLSDRMGRKPVLKIAALLFTVSAIGSALATSFTTLIIARMVGGLGVGAALILAPMYIAEIAQPASRGRMVSINQLNIVIGISIAFFTNFLILKLGQSDAAWTSTLRFEEWNWRWMLGLETLPAILYLATLSLVPESPRWLIMKGRDAEALAIMSNASNAELAASQMAEIKQSMAAEQGGGKLDIGELFSKPLRLVLFIGLSVAVLQQITGINSVFFYAPMIFEQSGIGTDAAFMQAILVGLTNLGFTLLAMYLIDKVGRKPLLVVGVSGIVLCMLLLAYCFDSATYQLTATTIADLPAVIDRSDVSTLKGVVFDSDLSYKAALADALGPAVVVEYESMLITAAANLSPGLILFGILGFVASFAISIGPVMWVLFSEIFPNRIRGLAISFVGLVNSGVSFLVQLIFPWELANLGSALTFFIYGLFAVVGLIIIVRLLPETKGKSLEELEKILVAE